MEPIPITTPELIKKYFSASFLTFPALTIKVQASVKNVSEQNIKNIPQNILKIISFIIA
jgi:hypothetical protein